MSEGGITLSRRSIKDREEREKREKMLKELFLVSFEERKEEPKKRNDFLNLFPEFKN